MKQSITAEEIICILEKMKDGNKLTDILREFDPEFSEEQMYYLHKRVLARNESNIERNIDGTFFSSAAEILREDKVTEVVYALAVYGHANYMRGIPRSHFKI